LIQRRAKAAYYKEHLKNVEYPGEISNTINCYFFFLILIKNRDRLNNRLNENGIETRITYPMPINEQPIFKRFSKEIYPMAKKISKSVISLPIYHKLTIKEQDYIIKIINKFRG
jgi:dTDP-4-amino-4,6-dideoxygalactose transaminase